MNYFKKMAFVLALVAGFCGGAWAADWGHRGANHAQNNHSWKGSVPEHGSASLPNRTWNSHNSNYEYRNGGWAYRNNPNYQYRNGQWVYVPNRTWGTYYPYGTYGSYYPYPTNGGYYPGGYGYGGPGTYGYGGYGVGNGQYQIGYNDGLVHGRTDRRMGRRYQPTHYDNYKHNNQVYRAGFANGYNAGYGRGW